MQDETFNTTKTIELTCQLRSLHHPTMDSGICTNYKGVCPWLP